jgi:hypothetical protein
MVRWRRRGKTDGEGQHRAEVLDAGR